MVTLRAYLNPVEAALAKSVLDDHGIFCTLADENVNLYGGGPLAMPIRLLVANEQAREADEILDHAMEDSAGFHSIKSHAVHEAITEKLARNNPWEILVLALLLLLPGLGLILQKHQLVLVPSWRRMSKTSLTIFSPAAAHFFGTLVIGLVVLLVILFFYIRRAIAREQAMRSELGNSLGRHE